MKTFEQLRYTNARDEHIVFGVGSVYHVNVTKDVTGLSDINNTIYSVASIGQHGSTYTGMRIDPRTITINGKIRDRERFAQLALRRQAVKILTPEIEGYLHYSFGQFKRKIWAKVDDSPIFTHKNLSEEFSIRFMCLSPFWEEEEERLIEIGGWLPDWEFPEEIEKDNPRDMIFGHKDEDTTTNVYNPGDVSTGMIIDIRAVTEWTTSIKIENISTGEFITINLPLSKGTKITINTNMGQKGARYSFDMYPDSYHNMLEYIDPDSTFFQLRPGDNLIKYTAMQGDYTQVKDLNIRVTFSPKYLGV